MHLKIISKQIDIGDSLRAQASDRITQSLEKFTLRPSNGHITFSRQGTSFRTDCHIHLASGLNIQARGEAAEIQTSFDKALERLEKQLRRNKRRLRDHYVNREDTKQIESADAPSYILSESSEEDAGDPPLEPTIVAESRAGIQEMTVGEAVMQLDLMEDPVLMFRNAGHGGLNVVYRRGDGNIGWIDPR